MRRLQTLQRLSRMRRRRRWHRALKSEQRKAPETTGQAAPTAPASDKKELKSQTMDKDRSGGRHRQGFIRRQRQRER